MPPIPRKGPFGFEIQHGSWQERLRALLAAERALRPGAARVALVVEGREDAGPLAASLAAELGPEVARIDGGPGLLNLSEHLDALALLDQEGALLAIAVAGTAHRKDGIQAAWRLGPLADRLWVFIHAATPPSGLVPTVGQHVRRYLDIVEGLAFSEGPKASR